MSDFEKKVVSLFMQWVDKGNTQERLLTALEEKNGGTIVLSEAFIAGFRAGYSNGQSDATRKETKEE